jgi:hypothetical protein
MILFFSGVTATIGLIGLFYAGFLVGNKNTPKNIARPPTADEEQRQKQMAIMRDFNNLMSYDEHKAYKKVT